MTLCRRDYRLAESHCIILSFFFSFFLVGSLLQSVLFCSENAVDGLRKTLKLGQKKERKALVRRDRKKDWAKHKEPGPTSFDTVDTERNNSGP